MIIEVLDARDPLGCRNYELEKEIQTQGKKLVLVLNKVDLVDGDNLKKWLKNLSKEGVSVLPF